jgi:fructose-1,6-bisphosphatase-3
LTLLEALAKQFPNIDSALAEIARLSAVLTLPKGTVHIISDIHGEDKKLRHVINNASGTLRPLVERLFQHRLAPDEFQDFLTLVFYPAEVTQQLVVRATYARTPVRIGARTRIAVQSQADNARLSSRICRSIL